MDKLNLKITGLLHDGRGIGFLPAASGRGKAIFVSGALPGQEVACSIQRDKGSFAEADLVEPIRSDWKAQHSCTHSAECGACPLLPLSYAQQLFWKERLALDALERIGKMEAGELDRIWQKTLASPLINGFRNKVELAFGNAANGLVLGFRQRRGHRVFRLESCLALPAGALPIIHAFRNLAGSSGLRAIDDQGGERRKAHSDGFWRFFILRKAFNPESVLPEWRAICITSSGDEKRRSLVAGLGRELLQDAPELACFIHEERRNRDFLAAGQTRVCCLDRTGRNNPQAAIMALPLGEKFFRLHASSFFQVNSGAASILAGLAADLGREACADGPLLDLYCGAGAPGLLLAPDFKAVLGVESDAAAIKSARCNAANFAPGQCRYRLGYVEKELARLAGNKPAMHWGTALLDPPRSGLSPGTLGVLMELAPENIIYISCNVSTLARDAALLNRGYEPVSLMGVDMFPHTPHLECCGLWKRRRVKGVFP